MKTKTLRQIIDENFGGSIKDFAKANGKSRQTVEQWLKAQKESVVINGRRYIDSGEITVGERRVESFIDFLMRQEQFTFETFGPRHTYEGVLKHIEKELKEIRENPGDITEWADLFILAMDGALRSGFTPEQISNAVAEKQTVNEGRDWPDWRKCDPDQPIEHVRDNK